MKNFFFFLFLFSFIAQVSAQIEINSSGFAGIGTANPQYRLDVAGDARITGNLYLGSSTSNFLGTTGNFPIAFKVNGVMAGFTGRSSNTNVSFGYGSLTDPLAGSYNTAIGFNALYSNTTGTRNTATGSRALYSNTEGDYNTANGYNALYSNITGTHNTATGYAALNFNTEGKYNTAYGLYALYSNETGIQNTANGSNTLYSNTTGGYNTATGYGALYSNTEGSRNTATGRNALYSNMTGIYNTATGDRALYSNTTGGYNTAAGLGALEANTEGRSNIATGFYSLYSNETGSYNTAIGYRALHSNKEGNYNTAIGHYANVGKGNLTNATAIGYGAIVSDSNQVRIGNSSVTSIGGYVAWSSISDGRAKKNIRADVPGLAFIKRLQPVTYNIDLDAIDALLKVDRMEEIDGEPLPQELVETNRKARADRERQVQTGFVAQDVETAAKSIGYDFSGVEADESGIYAMRYSEFVVPLVKAVQELSEQNERLQEQADAKDSAIALLLKQVNELSALVNRLLGN